MKKPLRVLMVEDSEDDALLTIRVLKKGGYDPEYERVETAEAMRKALREKTWDIIVCDYQMPKFNGLAAIALLKETGIDIPMIIVSGAIGEETAADCMRYGAHDYIMKGNLSRLVPAIERELKEAKSRSKRRQAEKALGESEANYRQLFDNAPAGIYQVNFRTGKFIKANDLICEYLGCSQAEITSLSPYDFITKEGQKLLTERLNKMALGEKVPEYPEYEMIDKNGKPLWLKLNVKNIYDSEGLAGADVVAHDITERKCSEEALRESEEKYRGIFENIVEGLFQSTPEGRFLTVNPAFARIFGYASPEEVISSITDIAHQYYVNIEDRLRYIEILREKGVVENFEFKARRKDGAEILISNNARAITDEEGKVIRYDGIVEDITERKRTEEALRASEELFRNYLEYAPDGVYMNDLEGNFLYGNIKCEEIIGYQREEVIGKNFLELNLLPEKNLNIAAKLLQANMEGRSTGPDEVNLIRKDGRLIPVEINTNVVQRMDQRIVLSFVRDISDRKRAEKKLKDTLDSLRKSFGATIQVMVSAVETRDPYTSGHQTRSADLAQAIATKMGLPQERIDGIRMAGSIHDIGKLSIPAEILSKPTKLTNIEFALIQEHARTGYEMLKDVESPWPLAEIVYQHHERMDGSGYPRNLKGEEIIMEARIMTVADVVEAMASHRPYRPALGIDAALKEIEKNKGTHYDVTVVEACLSLFREKSFQLEGA